MNEYERLKAQKDKILADQSAKRDREAKRLAHAVMRYFGGIEEDRTKIPPQLDGDLDLFDMAARLLAATAPNTTFKLPKLSGEYMLGYFSGHDAALKKVEKITATAPKPEEP